MQAFLKRLNADFRPLRFDHNRIQKADVRIGHLDGRTVERIVLFLRGISKRWKRELARENLLPLEERVIKTLSTFIYHELNQRDGKRKNRYHRSPKEA